MSTYFILFARRYLHALYNAKAVGKENAVTLESAGLVKHPVLAILILAKKVAKVNGKYYITEEYIQGMRNRWKHKNEKT